VVGLEEIELEREEEAVEGGALRFEGALVFGEFVEGTRSGKGGKVLISEAVEAEDLLRFERLVVDVGAGGGRGTAKTSCGSVTVVFIEGSRRGGVA
jgi:hypothetical protein